MEPDTWLGVELRHFAALQAVAAEGSFGRAAERLGYTQSAISQQIQTLERIVGEKLVERPGGPRAVSLTEAGRLLLRHAESIVARSSEAEMTTALRSGQRRVISATQSMPWTALSSLQMAGTAETPCAAADAFAPSSA